MWMESKVSVIPLVWAGEMDKPLKAKLTAKKTKIINYY